ncbi:MAG: hypothetical protein NC396_03270 [Bacteroides sp.]|nr:hypothetical protein [Bacteroides sp.]MCM1085147.1 hypothetical protein [Bacteroides sp.]
MPDFKLSLDDFEIESDELLAIAIHSPGSPYYRLAHSLNKKLKWNLVNIKIAFQPPESPLCSLNVLSHTDNVNRVQYLLVENRSGQQVWMPKMPDVDYWLVITGAGLEFLDTNTFLNILSETESIFSASLLPFDSLSGSGRTSPLFKYFQSLYNFLDYRGFIRNFD